MAGPNNLITDVQEVPGKVPVGTRIDTLSRKVLDNGRTAVAGALAGLTLAIAGNSALAQTSDNETVVVAQAKVNPEYDRIIAEAKAVGKDPVDYIDELRQSGKYSFAQARTIKKYIAEQAAIERRAREAGIDQAAIEDGKRIAGKEQAAIRAIAENNAIAIKFITVVDSNRKKGLKPTPDEIEHLKKIFNRKETSEDVRKLIQEKFGDLFDFRMLLAQA